MRDRRGTSELLAEPLVCRRLHATTTTMSVAQLSGPHAAASLIAGSSTHTFVGREDVGQPSSGHLSDEGRSLSRRSRVRRRGSRRDDDSSSDIFSISDDISSGQLFVKIPPSDGPSGQSPRTGSTFDVRFESNLTHAFI